MPMEAACCENAKRITSLRVINILKEVLAELPVEARLLLVRRLCEKDTAYAALITDDLVKKREAGAWPSAFSTSGSTTDH